MAGCSHLYSAYVRNVIWRLYVSGCFSCYIRILGRRRRHLYHPISICIRHSQKSILSAAAAPLLTDIRRLPVISSIYFAPTFSAGIGTTLPRRHGSRRRSKEGTALIRSRFSHLEMSLGTSVLYVTFCKAEVSANIHYTHAEIPNSNSAPIWNLFSCTHVLWERILIRKWWARIGSSPWFRTAELLLTHIAVYYSSAFQKERTMTKYGCALG